MIQTKRFSQTFRECRGNREIVVNKPLILTLYGLLSIYSLTVAQPLALQTLNTSYAQNFNTLASSGSSNVLPIGWAFSESGTGDANNGLFTASSGNLNGGDTYSFGENLSSERALGSLRSGSVVPLIGVVYYNASATAITSLQIQYEGEQWRLGAAQRGSDRLDFQISFDASSITTGTWINVNELDFVSPVTAGDVGALNGNLNTVTLAFEVADVSIASGQTFAIRWVDVDVAGSDDGLAIDNFTITPGGSPMDPSISFDPSAVDFGEVNVAQEKIVPVNVQGVNLLDSITVSLDDESFGISLDSIRYDTFCVLPPAGGKIYIRFTPSINGPIQSTIVHSSGDYEKGLPVSGFGFDQIANIIPITIARTKPDGTKVTVAGRVTVGYEHGNPAFIQDHTGGIPVFDYSLASSVAIGDSLIVTGFMSQFNDQKQISGPNVIFNKLATPSRPVDPKVLPLNALESNEGTLVQVNGVEMVNKNFVFFPNTTEQITDGTTQINLRIDSDTNLAGLRKPQASTSITGVVGRFKDNIQLIPRFATDIVYAVLPVLVSDTISKLHTLDVVNWNLEFFGAKREDYGEEFGPSNETLQRINAKTILDSLTADVMAVQEISDESSLDSLVKKLLNYNYICSPSYSYSFDGQPATFPPQKVCFIFDTTTVEVLSARPMFAALYDSARRFDPSILPEYPTGDPSSFYSSGRLPFLLNTRVTINGISEPVTFISLHAKSGSDELDFNRRRYDAQVLKDSLDKNFGDRNVIILGDFNDDLDESIAAGHPSPYSIFVADDDYVALTKSLSEAGARSTIAFNDMIDHQVISARMKRSYIEGSVTVVTPFRSIRNYANTTSDHLPILSRYLFSLPAVSFKSSSRTILESDTALQILIALSKPAGENVTLHVTLGGDAFYDEDFMTLPVSKEGGIDLEIAAGDSLASFQVFINDDEIDEFEESIALTISTSNKIVVGTDTHTIHIEDNDLPQIEFSRSEEQIDEGKQTSIKMFIRPPIKSSGTVTIQINHASHIINTVDYATELDASDSLLIVPITAGIEEVEFSFKALPDRIRDRDEFVDFIIVETSADLILGKNLKTRINIHDKKFDPEFSVYPNPVADQIHLTWNQVPGDSLFEMNIRKRSGEIIFKGSGTRNQLVDQVQSLFEHLRRGIYFVSLVYKEDVCTIRIVKE